jgi:GTP:adenosylcobinamide-phosphate guanylyltransferase
MSRSLMRVAVLCGGKGTRLGEPIKCLTEVAGRPFMDWKIEQLEWAGATDIQLLCGPYEKEFRKRYGARVWKVTPDNQSGVANALRVVNHGWWTWGDTLIAVRLWAPNESVMLVTRHPSANLAGIWLVVGLYYVKRLHRLIETKHGPYHINTREDLEATDAHIRRHGITR